MSPVPLGFWATAGASGAAEAPPSFDHLQTFNPSGSTFTISGLNSAYSSTYKHLQLRMSVLCNNTVGPDDLHMFMNGDTSSPWAWIIIGQNNATGRYSNSGAPNKIGSIYTLGAGQDYYATYILDIPDAFETTKNKVVKVSHAMFAQVRNQRGMTQSTQSAALDTLSFRPSTYSGYGTVFISPSKVSLYGIKGQ